jgi:hypothetical protein
VAALHIEVANEAPLELDELELDAPELDPLEEITAEFAAPELELEELEVTTPVPAPGMRAMPKVALGTAADAVTASAFVLAVLAVLAVPEEPSPQPVIRLAQAMPHRTGKRRAWVMDTSGSPLQLTARASRVRVRV